jgi:hypothetical protein
MRRSDVNRLVSKKKGILLDISWGGEQQPQSIRLGPSGDIDHIPTRIPFPLPAACCTTAVIVHVIEFLEQADVWRWWDELHRVMRPGGIVYVSGPYGGDESVGWLSDPQHRTRWMEGSFAWLDDRTPLYGLHHTVGRRPPKPWHMLTAARVPGTLGTVSYNVTLQAAANGGRGSSRRRDRRGGKG